MFTEIINRSNWEDGDYTDENGYLRCGKCHTEKQYEITLPAAYGGIKKKVSIMCKCKEEQFLRERTDEEKREAVRRVEALRRAGITDAAYFRNTFANDDMRNPKISEMCKEYAENWHEMKRDNTGILFYGDVGTGKSFFACCIANALIDKGIAAKVTNFPQILSEMQGSGGRQKTIDDLKRYPLLVIDDLGAERDTSFSVEQIYSVVDARWRAGKPLIVTTNLSIEELENPKAEGYKRIYDRVLGMCPVCVPMAGKSRRAAEAERKMDNAKQLLIPGVRT